MRILYIQATVVPPPEDVRFDRFTLLSETLEGDVLQPAWFPDADAIERIYGPGSYPVYTVGRFRYHWFPCSKYRGVERRRAIFRFYLRKARELLKKDRFDCIVAYSHMTTGVLAGLLGLLFRTKLIIELVTTPSLVYLTNRPRVTWKDRVMHQYSNVCLYISLGLAQRVHLLFPGQLRSYPLLRKMRTSVFHDYVPISAVPRHSCEQLEPYLLLVGAPWYLKGVDLLIQAFESISASFPNLKLKVLGQYSDQERESIAAATPNVEVLKPLFHPQALEVISRSKILLLPSRCEGLPRVLIEGMAAGLPLIGSDVAGIPFLIRDGENGFVFPNGNAEALAARLRQLLGQPELCRKMGQASYERAHRELNERVYAAQFTKMIEATVRGGP